MEKRCDNCANGRPSGRDGVWCLFYGIMINRLHEGCRAHRGGEEREGERSETRVD